MHWMIRRLFIASVCALVVANIGCAYRLPVIAPPSQETIEIISGSPEQYVLTVNTESITSYRVPASGRVAITIPGHRGSCGIYLFNKIKVGGDEDVLKEWNISVKQNGKIVQKITLRKLRSLPADQDGYRILRMNN